MLIVRNTVFTTVLSGVEPPLFNLQREIYSIGVCEKQIARFIHSPIDSQTNESYESVHTVNHKDSQFILTPDSEQKTLKSWLILMTQKTFVIGRYLTSLFTEFQTTDQKLKATVNKGHCLADL